MVQRRHEVQLSQRQLGISSRLGYQRIRHLEQGDGHHTLRLGELEELAAALGVEAWELLAPDNIELPVHTADSAKVLAALLRLGESAGRRLHMRDIGHAFRWTSKRVTAAVDQLAHELAPTGAALSRAEYGVKLVARSGSLTAAETSRLENERLPGYIYARDNARVLGLVARGEMTKSRVERGFDTRTHRSVGQLLRLGDIRATPDGGYELTPRAAFSLGLSNRLPPSHRQEPAETTTARPSSQRPARSHLEATVAISSREPGGRA